MTAHPFPSCSQLLTVLLYSVIVAQTVHCTPVDMKVIVTQLSLAAQIKDLCWWFTHRVCIVPKSTDTQKSSWMNHSVTQRHCPHSSVSLVCSGRLCRGAHVVVRQSVGISSHFPQSSWNQVWGVGLRSKHLHP